MPSLTRSQELARRNHDWLLDFEQGREDPVTGVVQPRSMAEIARAYRVTPEAVRKGIAAARKNREVGRGEETRHCS